MQGLTVLHTDAGPLVAGMMVLAERVRPNVRHPQCAWRLTAADGTSVLAHESIVNPDYGLPAHGPVVIA